MTVRGIGGNRLVYIKDGRRLNDGYAGGSGFLVGRGYFDVDSVKQVEVAKGAASSLYGSDGLGGIMVITTKDPKDYLSDKNWFAGVSQGYQQISDEHNTSLVAAGQLGNFSHMFHYTRRDGSETQNFDESLPGFDYDSNAFLVKSVYEFSENHWLKATLDYFTQDTEQTITAGENETRDDNENASVSLDYQWDANSAWFDNLRAQVYFTQYEQSSDQLRSGAGRSGAYLDYNDYRFEQDILGLRLVFDKQASFGSTEHSLVYGFDYDGYETERPRFKTRVSDVPGVGFEDEAQKAFPGADTTMAGLFVQDNIRFAGTALKLTLGARLDYYHMSPKESALYDEMDSITETALSPKVGLVYGLTDKLNLVAQYARGFKIPPHDQAYQSHGVEPFYQILPNADLDPESSDTFELGFKGMSDNISFELVGFYSQFDDFIDSQLVRTEATFIPGVNKSYYQYQNLNEVEVKGVEASVSYWLNDNLSVAVSAAYAHGKDKETDTYLTRISPLNGNLSMTYEGEIWSVTTALLRNLIFDVNGCRACFDHVFNGFCDVKCTTPASIDINQQW